MRAGAFAGQRHAGVRRALEAARKVSPVGTVQCGRPQGFPFKSRTTSLDDFEGYAGSLHWSGLSGFRLTAVPDFATGGDSLSPAGGWFVPIFHLERSEP